MSQKYQNKIKVFGIDARFYGPVGKGLGRYTKEIVDRILAFDQVNNYVIFLSLDNYADFKILRSNVKKVLIKSRWYTLREQFELPLKIYQEKIDLMHFPHFNVPIFCPTKYIVTIHDLILTRYATVRATTLGPIKYIFKNLGYRLVIRRAINKAIKVIAVSLFTKNDIVSYFKISADKIVLSYEGVTSLKAGEKSIKDFSDEKILMCYNIKHPYLLYVGNAYPHKNLETLLNVFKQLVDNRYQKISLVLIGKEDYFYKKIKEHAQKIRLTNDQVVFPGYVSDNELASFYKNALSYVFPSLYEGFGLPPLEAMSMGCPVLSSSLTSMPEVLEDAALFFDPQDEKDFLKKMNIIIIDDQLRKSLVIKGLALIKKYSWDKCAMITYDSYINSFIE